jgi:hypothetical protein
MPLFALLIFQIGFQLYAKAILDLVPPSYASFEAGCQACVTVLSFLLVEMGGGLENFLPGLALNHDSLNLCLPSS